MHVHPHLGAFRTGRLLVPWVEIKLELFCNTPEFFMFGTTIAAKRLVTLKAEDLKVKLYLCHVSFNTNVYNELKEKREAHGHPARYPVVRSIMRTFAFAEKDDVFVGRNPDCMIVGLVDSRAFNGTLDYDPFAFQKFGLTEIPEIIKDETYPYDSLKMVGNDGTADCRGYDRLLEASGAWH